MHDLKSRRSHYRYAWSAALALIFAPACIAAAQGVYEPTWTLVVCAARDNLPYSNDQQQGFENGIISEVARGLNAELEYVWLPSVQVASQNVLLLDEGRCDVMLDVGDTADDFLTTLAYYQSTYYFLYRADAAFRVTSFDDDVLARLRVGVVAASPPDVALGSRGLTDNLHHYFPDPATPEAQMIEDVVNETIDLAVIFGPMAGDLAREQPGLVLVPVTPEVDLSGLSMVYQTTMGVRKTDTDLRDLLNDALAREWGDIQAVLERSGVPLLPLPAPVTTVGASGGDPLRIGVILPTTGDRTLGAFGGEVLVGQASNLGALMAGDEVAGMVGPAGQPFKALISSAPDTAAMRRAAERMVNAENVFAIVGGFGSEDAEALSELAAERGVVFVNVGAESDSLRGASCSANTFHLAPSAAMYLDAIAALGEQSGFQRWFVVYDDNDEQRANQATLVDILQARENDQAVGSAMVPENVPLYAAAFAAIAGFEPDVIVLLLSPNEQLTFLAQYASFGANAATIGYPAPATQTRQFYAAYLQNLPSSTSAHHLASWEATLETAGAADVNLRFLARNGRAMDPSAWAAYAGVRLVAEAATAAGSVASDDLIAYMGAGETVFDILKGEATSFRPWDHQMRQPLYLVESTADYQKKTSLLDLAGLEAELPTAAAGVPATQRLDQLGTGEDASRCRLDLGGN